VASRLGDPSAEVRYAAAVVLAGYGETARRALPNLRTCLQDPVEKVAMCATGAIKKIESPES
jgi:HEAT repeat protein